MKRGLEMNSGHDVILSSWFVENILPLSFSFLLTMNNKRLRSQDENRLIICATCGKKDTKCSKITPAIEHIIQLEVNKTYSLSDGYFPCGVCGQCRKWLFASKKGVIVPESVRERWNSIDFSGFTKEGWWR